MMTKDVITSLEKEVVDEFHAEMLEHVKVLLKRSRSKMSRWYCEWDHQDQVFRGEVAPDKDDIKQESQGKPIKMVIPNTYAQCMSFTSFLFLMYLQNETFFELKPTGDEDTGKKAQDCEAILERDLRRNQFNTTLFQHLLDIPRFGLGILDNTWTKQYTKAYVESEPIQMVNPTTNEPVVISSGGSWQEFLKFEGNLIRPVSPYRFFPDTNFPLTDYHKGTFCGIEEAYSVGALQTMEANGEVTGIDFIEPLPINWLTEDGRSMRTELSGDNVAYIKNAEFSPKKPNCNVLVSKMQVKIVPHRFKVDGKPLGDEEFEVLYNIWVANNSRIIKLERAGWWHGEFGYSLAQFTPDMHHTVNLGLADLIYRLQDVISWFVNSHITSVRRMIQNRLIIDPRIIDTATLDGEGDIYLRRGVSVPNLERAVGQLRVQDVTGQHMTDMEILSKIMQQVTGVNDNMSGQYNSGRRSAQESRVVTAGAAGRMKLHGHLIWEASLGRLGRLMLSNSRQSLSFESFTRIVGKGEIDPTTGASDIQTRYAAFKGTPEEVICSDDYMVFDSTLSSEKGFMAQAIQELLSVVLQANPMAAQQFVTKVDPVKMVNEMFSLRGAGSVSRFNYSPGKAPQFQPQVVPGQAPAVATVPAQ